MSKLKNRDALNLYRSLRQSFHSAGLPVDLTTHFVKSVMGYIASYTPGVVEPPHLPVQPLDEVFPGIDTLSVCFRYRAEPVCLPYGEAFVLAAITAYIRPSKVFEFGTWLGASALVMAQQAGPDCRVYTLDLPPDESQCELPVLEKDVPASPRIRTGERFRGVPELGQRIVQLYGDSATFDFTPWEEQIDLVFIDGSHSYAYVKSDTQQALRMLSSRGVIVWDDCSIAFPSVVRALDEFGVSLPISRIARTRLAVYCR